MKPKQTFTDKLRLVKKELAEGEGQPIRKRGRPPKDPNGPTYLSIKNATTIKSSLQKLMNLLLQKKITTHEFDVFIKGLTLANTLVETHEIIKRLDVLEQPNGEDK